MGKSLKIVHDARQIKTMIEDTKFSLPIEPKQRLLTRIKGPVFSTADMKNAYNQGPLVKPSQRRTNFAIARQQ